MHSRVEMEIMARGLEWGVIVIQMRLVTKESLTIITIKKMELLRLAALCDFGGNLAQAL